MSAIRRVSLSEQVLNSILNYIQEHHMQVGDKLPTESEFSEEFQVSRTSVREVMKGLSMNGAVKAIPGKGTFMCTPMLDLYLNRGKDLTVQADISISHIMEVRTALEVLSAELAIDRAAEEDLQKLRNAMEDLHLSALSEKSWAVPGANFHVCIAKISQNPLLQKTIESYSRTTGKYRDAMAGSDTKIEDHINEHEAIMNAICTRDKKAARAAVLLHMKNTELELKRLVDENSVISFISKP